MTDTPYGARIREIFHAALDLPPEKRTAYLATTCGGEAGLRDAVQALIDAHAEPGVLDRAPHATPPDPRDLGSIGPFRIVDLIGEGGMGRVYLAERVTEDYTQRVALKLMRAGYGDANLEERLRKERRILALLEHPGIARLIDGGTTDDGQPFIAMEYIDGSTLVDFCDRQRLSISQRLELFLKVCDPLQYAHQQLVVHQDLKPNNILVTPEGHPKLLDFGIAKLLDPAEGARDATRTAPWFTPAYASPEQVRGERVSTLSDVYTLGVILYELITGRLPYKLASSSAAEVERVVCEEVPERPSAVISKTGPLPKLLAGDLDIIVLKALAKEPERRYASVEQLAADIQRLRTGRPIHARPDSFRYRAAKFVRRHQTTVSATAVMLLSLIFGVVAATWQARLAREQATIAGQARVQAETVSDFVIDLFQTSDVAENAEPARDILRRGVRQAEAMVGQPMARAQMLQALGQAYMNLGDYEEAQDLLERALTGSTTVNPDGSAAVAHMLTDLAEVHGLLGDENEVAVLDRAFATAQNHLGPGHPLVARILIHRARIAISAGRMADADENLQEALRIRTTALGPDDPSLAEVFRYLGESARRRGDFPAAEEYFRRVIAHRERTLGLDHALTATGMLFLGDLLFEVMGDTTQAEPLFRRALEIQEEALGRENTGLSHALHSLSDLLASQGKYDEAEVLARRVSGIMEAVYGPESIHWARTLEVLADMLVVRGGADQEALDLYHHSIAVKKKEEMYWSAALTMFNVSDQTLQSGDLAAAEQLALEAIEMLRSNQPLPAQLATAQRALSRVYVASEAYALAESHALEAVRLSEVAASPSSLRAAYRQLARVYEAWDKPDQAARYRELAGDQ